MTFFLSRFGSNQHHNRHNNRSYHCDDGNWGLSNLFGWLPSLPRFSVTDSFLAIVAIFFPPVPVFVKTGCSASLVMNFALCLMGIVPGIIHAWYVILTANSYNYYRNYHNHGRHNNRHYNRHHCH